MKYFAAAAASLLIGASAGASTVWPGYGLTFTKPAFADFSSPEFQDRITPSVWLTRGDNRGLFNIAQEVEYQGVGSSGPSPLDTEWAFGTTAQVGSLSFFTWAVAADAAGGPPGLVGLDMVVHLISDDIFIDIRFTEWGARQGGSFQYMRGVPGPGGAAALWAGVLALTRRRR